MKHIILESKAIEGIVFDLTDLNSYLNQLTDTRDNRGKIYSIGNLLCMLFLAKLSGQDKPQAIFQWIRNRCTEFVAALDLKRHQTPCLNTISTLLEETILLDELEQKLSRYLFEQYGGQSSSLIAIDGKTMRGTIPKGKTQGVHLLSAYLAEEGVVLKQVAVPSKNNEMSAAPALLAELDLKNKIVCADAMQTQRAFCQTVLGRGGQYLLWAKDNQPTLLEDIRRFFTPVQHAAGWHIPPLPQTSATSWNKGHGRIERRTLTLMQDDAQFIDWPGVKQVFKLERYTKCITTGKETTEHVYGLTSCSFEQAHAEQLLQWTRQYWAIENGLHYRRDVTLQEDATRIFASDKRAEAIAIINNFIVGLTQKLGYKNLPEARRYFDASIASQLYT